MIGDGSAARRAQNMGWAVVPTTPPPHAWLACNCSKDVVIHGKCLCSCHGRAIVTRSSLRTEDR